MSEFSNDAGAEAGTETVTTTVDPGASGGTQSHIPANYDADGGSDGGNVDAGADGAGAEAGDKPTRPPLSTEEYQQRHDNMNAALREERAAKREMQRQVEQLRATVDHVRETQPEMIERFNLEVDLANYGRIDWNRWAEMDRPAAEAAFNEYRGAQARMAELDQAKERRQQEAERQQGQRQLESLGQTLQEQEAAFTQANPDYKDAISFLRADLVKEANRQGVFGQEADAAVYKHLVTVGMKVQAQGMDLAKFSYDMAVDRGYQRKAAANLAPMIAGAEAAKTISNVTPSTSGAQGGQSFEEQMAGVDGAAGRSFWEKAKRNRGRAR